MIKSKVKLFTGEGCTDTELGCYINFNPESNSGFQTIPSNSNNYFLVLDGMLRITYDNGSTIEALPLHKTENWSNYQDPWIYSVNHSAKTFPNTRVLQIELVDTQTSQYNFKAKKIENETISINTTPNSILISYGSNLTVDGASVDVLNSYQVANSNTYNITASDAATLIFIEKL